MEKCKILIMLVLLACLSPALAEEGERLTVFCGAGLTGALSEIGGIYENATNISVEFNFDARLRCAPKSSRGPMPISLSRQT